MDWRPMMRISRSSKIVPPAADQMLKLIAPHAVPP
jgi:hypothetical protein